MICIMRRIKWLAAFGSLVALFDCVGDEPNVSGGADGDNVLLTAF